MTNSNRATIAAVLELVGGYFGLLGLGWILAGDFLMGLILLVSYVALLAVLGFLTFISFGCLGFILAPIYIAAPIISAIKAYQFALDNRY